MPGGLPGKVTLISLLVAFSLASSAVAASGGVGGRPANPDPDNPRTRSIFIYTLKAGSVKSDQIFLSNAGDREEVVELYVTDGVASNTGAFTCEQEVEPRGGVGAWVTFSVPEVTIPAKGDRVVDFTLKVPSGIEAGEHGGCVVIQKRDDSGAQNGAFVVKTRQAVRVAVIVPGDIHRKITVTDFTAQSLFGAQKYSFGLVNDGNVSADVNADVIVRDVFGNVTRVNEGQHVVLPNNTFDSNYSGSFSPFFGGWYTADVNIAYDKRAGTFGTSDTNQLLYGKSESVSIFIWPSVWFFIMVGIFVLSALTYIAWRKFTRRR